MIEAVKEEQLGDCLQVIRAGFKTVADEFGLTPETCATHGAFMCLSRLQRDFAQGKRMFAFHEDEKIVGFVLLEQLGAETWAMEKLAVLPQCRHRGHGSALVAFAKSEAKQLGAKKISIGIIEEHALLKDWYALHGFVHVGTKSFAHLPFTAGFMEYTCDANRRGELCSPEPCCRH